MRAPFQKVDWQTAVRLHLAGRLPPKQRKLLARFGENYGVVEQGEYSDAVNICEATEVARVLTGWSYKEAEGFENAVLGHALLVARQYGFRTGRAAYLEAAFYARRGTSERPESDASYWRRLQEYHRIDPRQVRVQLVHHLERLEQGRFRRLNTAWSERKRAQSRKRLVGAYREYRQAGGFPKLGLKLHEWIEQQRKLGD